MQGRKIRDKEGPNTSNTNQHDWKMRDQIPRAGKRRTEKCGTGKCKTKNAGAENAGPKNVGRSSLRELN